MTRKVLWPILLIGVVLIVVPFAISLPSKASAGQKMLDNFHPIMQRASVTKTVDYYNNTFIPLRGVAVGGVQAANETPNLIAALAKQLHTTPAQVQQFLGTNFPPWRSCSKAFHGWRPSSQTCRRDLTTTCRS